MNQCGIFRHCEPPSFRISEKALRLEAQSISFQKIHRFERARLVGRGFNPDRIRAARRAIGIVGFTGCGKTHLGLQEVSGHDFSRAVETANEMRL
jgi:hypothetical protein